MSKCGIRIETDNFSSALPTCPYRYTKPPSTSEEATVLQTVQVADSPPRLPRCIPDFLLDMTSLNIPPPSEAQIDRGYGAISSRTHLGSDTVATDFGSPPGPSSTAQSQSQSQSQHPHPQPQPQQQLLQLHQQPQPQQQQRPRNLSKFNEEWDASQRGSSIIAVNTMQRADSVMSQGDTLIATPSRGGTLKKKASVRRTGSLKRSSSRRSSRAGSVRSLALHTPADVDEAHSAFYSPVPTADNPTDILANRFQGM